MCFLQDAGGAGYKQESDVVRVKAKTTATAAPVESFTIQFANVKPTGADLQVMWDNTSVSLPIDTDIDRKVMTQITDVMTKDNRPYYQAGLYYLENGKDLNQALSWLDKAVDQQPNAFWIHHQRANALAKLGRKQEAKQSAQKSMDLAKQQNNSDYVRLNEKLIATLN